MAKQTRKSLITEADVRRMKRLAGLIDDDTDLEACGLLNEGSEVPGEGPQSPTGATPPTFGGKTPVLNEEDGDDEEFESEETDTEVSSDSEEVGGFEDLDGDSESGLDHPEPDADNLAGGSPTGLDAGGSDKMAIANALKVLGQALGITVEVEGEGSEMGTEAPAMGDEMGMESSEMGDELGTEAPAMGDEMNSGVPGESESFGQEEDLNMEQQKMLAEIFAKTSKQILKTIQQSQAKNKAPKRK